MKKVLLILFCIIIVFTTIIVILRMSGYIFLLSNNTGCTVGTEDGHLLVIRNNKTALKVSTGETIPYSKLIFKRGKILGCMGGL